MDTRQLSDVPQGERNNWLADMGERLADGTLSEEEAAVLIFWADPYYALVEIVPAWQQLI